jgi:5-methylcytosine-specific restriction endonuclease McrA
MKRYGQRFTEQDRLALAYFRRLYIVDYNAMVRARRFTGDVELVSRVELMKRDGETCYLCGEWMSIHESSLDHVVPLSRGGSHTYANVKLAHRVCNSRKGKKLLAELVR